jgi:hypothetical protein
VIVDFDASALVKRYVAEVGSAEVDGLISSAAVVGTAAISRHICLPSRMHPAPVGARAIWVVFLSPSKPAPPGPPISVFIRLSASVIQAREEA